MNRSFAALLPLLTMLFAPLPAAAKAGTVRIEIRGSSLAAPIEITNPDIVKRFSIWNGPGVRVNDQPVHLDPNNTAGMFIDWPKGMAGERSTGLQRFDVTFYLESPPTPNGMHGWYVVMYEFDPSSAGGYIYLPGPNDEGFGRNVTSIIHDVEGNWFHSSRAWEEIVRPLIEKADARD